MKLTMLGTGKALVTECYNTCLVIEDNRQYFMVDVLTVYSRQYDEDYPVVYMDEKPIRLFVNAKKGFLYKNGRTEYGDYEYIRNETASIFLFTETLNG